MTLRSATYERPGGTVVVVARSCSRDRDVLVAVSPFSGKALARLQGVKPGTVLHRDVDQGPSLRILDRKARRLTGKTPK